LLLVFHDILRRRANRHPAASNRKTRMDGDQAAIAGRRQPQCWSFGPRTGLEQI